MKLKKGLSVIALLITLFAGGCNKELSQEDMYLEFKEGFENLYNGSNNYTLDIEIKVQDQISNAYYNYANFGDKYIYSKNNNKERIVKIGRAYNLDDQTKDINNITSINETFQDLIFNSTELFKKFSFTFSNLSEYLNFHNKSDSKDLIFSINFTQEKKNELVVNIEYTAAKGENEESVSVTKKDSASARLKDGKITSMTCTISGVTYTFVFTVGNKYDVTIPSDSELNNYQNNA